LRLASGGLDGWMLLPGTCSWITGSRRTPLESMQGDVQLQPMIGHVGEHSRSIDLTQINQEQGNRRGIPGSRWYWLDGDSQLFLVRSLVDHSPVIRWSSDHGNWDTTASGAKSLNPNRIKPNHARASLNHIEIQCSGGMSNSSFIPTDTGALVRTVPPFPCWPPQ